MSKSKDQTETETTGARTRPDDIADELIARVFLGELKPGDQLQPSRTLAVEMGVDRTSLRMALRQLARMNVIRPVQGSGVTVLDYRECAGVEFITSVFALPDVDLGGAFLLEALGLWISVMPAISAGALSRATPADFQRLDGFFAKQLAMIDRKASLEEIVELELEAQHVMAKLYGSTVLTLVANTTLSLRRTLVKMLFETIDVRRHVESQREQLHIVMTEKLTPEEIAFAYRAYLQSIVEGLRDRLAKLPLSPSRVKSRIAAKPFQTRRAYD